MMSIWNTFFKKLVPTNRKSWSVFMGCVFTAALFWLFLTFSRSFESELVFNVEYRNFPADKILINNPIEDLKLKVKAKGFDLFRYTLLDKKQQILFDLNDFKMVKRGKVSTYYLALQESPTSWFSENKSSFKVMDFSSDTIRLQFDDVAEKKVPVVPKFNLTIDTLAFEIKSISTTPDSILIRGSNYFLSKINEIETEKITVSGTNSKINIPINRAKGVLEMVPNSVELKLNFEALVQKKMEVPIRCTDCPSDLQLKLFPSTVTIGFTCTESKFSVLKKSDFQVAVKYSEIEQKMEKLFINLLSFPDGISTVQVSPAKADYLIRKI